jgi:hypothetical protein
MSKVIPDLNPKNLFKAVYVGYLLAGMHFNIEHVGVYGTNQSRN